MNLIDKMSTPRTLPYIGGLSVMIPWDMMSQIRSNLVNTSEKMVFDALDSIGVDALADVVAQGALMSDIAETLDLPVMKVNRWFHAVPHRWDEYCEAEQFASDHHVSEATRRLMGVGTTDTDAMKIAKTQADHLKWMAARKDREKYGDKVTHNHGGDVGLIFQITTGGHVLDHTQKEIIEV